MVRITYIYINNCICLYNGTHTHTYLYVIFSDSLSVLLSLNNKKLEHPLIIKLLCRLHSTSNEEIVFCWIPSHIGVGGNHRAGAAAKSAFDLTPDKYNIPYSDLKPKMNNFLHKNGNNTGIEISIINYSRLNLFWENGTQLSEIAKRASNNIAIAYWSQQTYALFYTQARTATTVLDRPNALHKHVLLECKVFNNIRKHYFHANTMKGLFQNVHMDNVLSFLKKTGLYQKI